MVNLMKQTLTINVAQTAADTIASQIETIVHGHEPDVEVSEIVQESYIPEKKQEANESYNNEDCTPSNSPTSFSIFAEQFGQSNPFNE